MDISLLLDAIQDSAKTIPLLLGTFLLLEWLEYRSGHFVQARMRHAGKAGPALGALFGSLPHFSVVGSALYARQMLSLGSLLAIYLASSDEAIPVILAQPKHIGVIVPLVLTKIGVAIIFGLLIDLFVRATARPAAVPEMAMVAAAPASVVPAQHAHADEHGEEHAEHAEEHAEEEDIHEDSCCGHHIPAEKRGWSWLTHPLIHTGKVFLFILLVTMTLNYLTNLGQGHIERFLLQHSPLQPLAAALVGLIPNCAASVAITQLYLKGAISFGSVIAGLCCSAGVGLLVLLKENRDHRDTLRIIALQLLISFGVGLLIQSVLPGW